MKKLNLFIGVLIVFIFFSCSSDDSPEQQLTLKESLIQGSPWTYNHYELINIIDSGNSDFTQTDIENYTNESQNGNVITFNNNGTGSSFLPNEGTDSWQWEIINDNELKLTFDSGNTSIIENISATTTQMVIEIESVSYDEDVQYEILHYGKFIYE